MNKRSFTTVVLAAMSCVGVSAADNAKPTKVAEEVVSEGEIAKGVNEDPEKKDKTVIDIKNPEIKESTQG